MASFNPLKSALIINVQTGLDTAGEPIIKARRYQNVKTAVTADAVMTTGNAISGLQKYSQAGIMIDQVSNVA
ncbi:MAG: DUF1659 domain-containing protein [Methylocystaceae bacterium]